MSSEVSISKWGNSQGLRIPKEIIESLDIKVGDKVKLFVENNRIIIEPIKKKKEYSIDELVAKIPNNYLKEPEVMTTPMGREIW